jgi:hypothetical protein
MGFWSMKTLETLMNQLTDADWGWWPVVFLRPPRDHDIDTLILLKMTCVFGVGTGFIVIGLMASNGIELNTTRILLALVAGCLGFFIVYRTTFAYFWNRRAKRLRDSKSVEATA